MPRVNGVYQLLPNVYGTADDPIQSAPYNAQLDDLATEANSARPVKAGGTGAATPDAARLNLGIDLTKYVTVIAANTSKITRLKADAARRSVYWIGSNRPGPYASGISGGPTAAGRTFVMKNAVNHSFQDGFIRKVNFTTQSNGGDPSNSFKLKVLRPNGSSYDVVAETALIAVGAGNALKTFVLPSPLGPFRMGDALGIFMTGGVGATSWGLAGDNTGAAAGSIVQFVTGDAISGAVWSEDTPFVLPMWGTGPSPLMISVGDSIIEGHPNYHSFLHLGPAGDRNNDIMYHVMNAIPNFDYQNFGRGGSTWADVLSISMLADNAPSEQPRSYLFYCGVNDIVNGRTWAQVQADMYSCLARVADGTPVFLSEMIPYSGPGNATDAVAAKIRDFNQRYADWAGLNGVTLLKCWDAMGQVRPSTGFKDDLIAAYNTGDGHLTTAGAKALAEIYVPQILNGL
ncbi:SGNH/GDSL hydrolase family protein [Mesorhizobium sp. NPDC059025]|uniref:SGNH/GDSL hydrolase family protein n=1 Tax=unclassified Mesorhizobium TaxID=325217 RepID=UPI00369FEA88